VVGLFLLLVYCQSFTQEAWETHTRGLLHQTVFNTGALGVRYNLFRSQNSGNSLFTPFEWPGNSHFSYFNTDYWYYNQNGGGLMMLADTGVTGHRATRYIVDSVAGTTIGADMIGCLGLGGSGIYRDGTGIHYWPGTVKRDTNYPLLSDGSLNTNYNPNEAEEIITSSVYTPYGIKITRTSREWSYPGYDSFIIYDYEFKNTGEYFKNTTGAVSPTHATDTISNIAVDWIESFLPSYVYSNQDVGDFTSGGDKELGRIDLRRYMTYVSSPDGRPSKTSYANWSAKGTYGGGLRAPAAAGYMFLYYDYDHLMTRNTSRFFYKGTGVTPNDSIYIFDANMKFKQPWVLSRTQAGLAPTKAPSHVSGPLSRYAPWNPQNTTTYDSLSLNAHNFGPVFAQYWYGRARENFSNNTSNMVHSMVLGPYILPPDESFHVVVAEVAGFGPGRKWDSKYCDYGGGTETSIVNDDFMHPVASWDSVITYPVNPPSTTNYTPKLNTLNTNAEVGIAYTPTYGIPGYIRDTNVVSIRDVADRCIQLYTGNSNIIKFDTTQYEPWGNTAATSNGVTANAYAPSPSTIALRTYGWNAGISIPFPSPVFTIETIDSSHHVRGNKITWGPQVESFTAPRLRAPFHHYEVLRATSPIGPWNIIDSVGKGDIRYYNSTAQKYSINDSVSDGTYYYTIVSVDESNGKSGLTNMKEIQSNSFPDAPILKSPADTVQYTFVHADQPYITLYWSVANSTKYWVQTATDSLFQTIIRNDTVSYDPFINDTVASQGIQFNRKYYWRVAGINSIGTGLWSAVGHFYLIPLPPQTWFAVGTNSDTSYGKMIIKQAINPTMNSTSLAAYDYICVYCKFNGSYLYAGGCSWGTTDQTVQLYRSRGDTLNSGFKGGFITGDTVYFRLWDHLAMKGYDAVGLVNGNVPVFHIDSTLELTSLTSSNIISTAIETGNHPYQYSLGQNYPNPFNPTTQIKYAIAKPGMATLIVYDLLGRELCTLVNEVKQPGNYTASWNAAKLSSGVYFYRLKSGSFAQTKKMVLLK
jgi:hypothetical protein